MLVTIEKTGESKELTFNGKALKLLEQLGLNIEEVIITQNGSVIAEDTVLADSDSIKLLSVVSGG